MTKRNYLLYLLVASTFVISSCKSCKNKFSKQSTTAESTPGIDTGMYAGLNDTTNKTATASSDGNSSTSSSAASVTSAESNASNKGTTANSDAANSSSTGKTMAKDVESASAAKSSHHRGGASRSIYDGINDQEERYVVRKAEGYNDAYYIDDYNGSNKFYEEHYKKASTLEKPAEQYIDKSMNLPTTAYTKGPTQKSIDAQNPPPPTDDAKTKPAPVGTGPGTIGVTKKSNDKKK